MQLGEGPEDGSPVERIVSGLPSVNKEGKGGRTPPVPPKLSPQKPHRENQSGSGKLSYGRRACSASVKADQ